MVGGLALLLVFQLAGDLIATLTGIPIPGPVIGMLLLFLVLLVRTRVPEGLERASSGLLSMLSLLFVPAGTGIVAYLALIRQEWLPIAAALVGSTLLTIGVTAVTMQTLAAVGHPREPHDAT
ncbi:MAG: CidA/LrgA family protein [Anaerolineae bacterium]|jgi:holin-like protein|nr:CidA/LrgA family protein [Anaerolineae bacterium]